MAPRTSWKGFLKLSLISVPVKAFTANNTSEDVRLNQLHADCNSRVKYKKVCPEHGELKSDEIVSGYEYAKDQYVIIGSDEIDKLRAESDKSVRIDGFIPPDAVDPVYYAGKTYYLLPDGVAGTRPYVLLHRGMVDAGVHAIAQVVIAGREQLVLLRPVDKMLVMSVLNVAKKVKSIVAFVEEIEDDDVVKEELDLAGTLIDASTIAEFDYADYKDGYVEKLSKLIQMKVDGQEIVQARDPEEPKIINLMDALKKSVAEARSEAPAKRPAAATRKSSAKSSAKTSAKAPTKTSAKAPTKTSAKTSTKKKMAPSRGRKKAARKKKSG